MDQTFKVLAGSIFMLISAILFSAQFITAAILSVNKNSWGNGAIYNVFDSAGYILVILSICSLIVGVVLVVMGLKKQI